MNSQLAYNTWASQYDTNKNKTRDLEAIALREVLSKFLFENCLEVGCGTGKNTEWIAEKAKYVTAIDLSEEMLAKARQKIKSDNVQFIQADINTPWNFGVGNYEMVSFSLVLEHIENLDHIFSEASKSLKIGGYIYIGELHPFKQYAGTKARFDSEEGRHVVECFIHNVSDFILIPKKYGLKFIEIKEYFDDDDMNGIPRILAIILKKIQ